LRLAKFQSEVDLKNTKIFTFAIRESNAIMIWKKLHQNVLIEFEEE